MDNLTSLAHGANASSQTFNSDFYATAARQSAASRTEVAPLL